MRFTFPPYSDPFLEYQRFREPCNPLHQGEEQPDTELFLQAVPFILCYLLVEGKKRIVGGKVEEIETDQFSPPPPFPPTQTKHWHSKNGSGHGGNPRNASLYRTQSLYRKH